MGLPIVLRKLQKEKAFTLTAVLTLAIGIGAATSVFSLIEAVLLRPLPFPEPNRIMYVSPLVARTGEHNAAAAREDEISYPDFFDWREQNRSFDGLASYHTESATLRATKSSFAIQTRVAVVSSDLFRVLGVSPLLGRAFTREEEQPGHDVMVLSYALWQSEFAGDPGAIGRTAKLGGRDYIVAGVMPEGFSYPLESPAPALWLSPAFDAYGNGDHPSTQQRGWTQLSMVGRLKPGVTPAAAQAELAAIQKSISRRYPESDADVVAARVEPELQHLVGDTRPAMLVLAGSVGALMLIACANVAGLLLARGRKRQTELAVRSALGASRGRIVREVMSEAMVLAALGGIAGIALAWLALNLAGKMLPATLPRASGISMNVAVAGFAVLASLLTGVVFGALPARKLSRIDPGRFMRDGMHGATGRGRDLLHGSLVVAETAVGLVLLIAAGLLIRSFLAVITTNPGFDPRHVLTFSVGIPEQQFSDEQRMEIDHRILQGLAATPGVQSATAGFPLPLSGGNISMSFRIEGRPVPAGEEPDARMSYVEPNFLKTLGIPLLRGRGLEESDNRPQAPPVILINETMAREYFPNADPIGRKVQTGGASDPWGVIVGVTGDVLRSQLTEPAHPEVYVPYEPNPIAPESFAVRVAGDPGGYAREAESIVRSINPGLPVYRIGSYESLVDRTTAESRFETMVLSGFAALALLLAAVGLYAVLSYTVAQRAFEISVRMAVGARRSDVLEMVLHRGLYLAAAGLGIGLAVSALLTHLMRHLLHGVGPTDPVTFIVAATVLLGVSAIASFAPAWRAAQMEPMDALRNQ